MKCIDCDCRHVEFRTNAGSMKSVSNYCFGVKEPFEIFNLFGECSVYTDKYWEQKTHENDMIAILGESASGKSTVQKVLCDKFGYNRLVTYTTRKPRNVEVDGVDYHFISEDDFVELSNQKFFCEQAVYNGWHYGTAAKDCTKGKVVVITPHGLRQMKKYDGLNIYSVYLNVPRRDRLVRLLNRGDDIEEAYRRSLSDVGQYDGISDEVDTVIVNENNDMTSTEIAKRIILRMREDENDAK